MYQLIASDLDGTLLNRNHQISPKTYALLNAYQQQNYHLVIATGRHYRDVKTLINGFNCPMYLITSNGARVHTSTGELLLAHDVPPVAVDDILRLTKGCEFYRNLYHDDHWFVEQENEHLLSYTRTSGFSYTFADFAHVSREGISKMLFIGDADELNVLERVLVERYGDHLHITFSLPTCLEIMGPQVNKGMALASVYAQLDLEAKNVIAFGDGLNDLEMLQQAGCGVLMANADSRLKNLLPNNPQTIENDRDGVIHYLLQELGDPTA